jgi:hypothetical protein
MNTITLCCTVYSDIVSLFISKEDMLVLALYLGHLLVLVSCCVLLLGLSFGPITMTRDYLWIDNGLESI